MLVEGVQLLVGDACHATVESADRQTVLTLLDRVASPVS